MIECPVPAFQVIDLSPPYPRKLLDVFCVSNESNLRGLLQRSYKSAYRG
jgi:hypothetical protein